MIIKSLGYKITDEESGIVFDLIPKTEEATQEIVEKFFDSFQILKAETPKIEPLREEKEPRKKRKYVRLKPEKITKFEIHQPKLNRGWGNENPIILDPFAGSGSIPFEAMGGECITK